MSRKWLLAGPAIVVITGAAAALFLTRSKPQPVPTHPAQPPPAAAPAPSAPEITLSGQVQAANVVSVPAPVDGTIEELMAAAGDVVIEGRLLARIKNPKLVAAEAAAQSETERASNHISELEAAVIAARLEESRSEADQARVKVELERADKEFQKQQLMFRQGITARLVFEKAQQDYNALKADSERLAEATKNAVNRVASVTDELQGARKDLEKAKAAWEEARAESVAGDVRSPTEGIIVARCCQVGESVTAGSTNLFQIAGDLTSLEVAASADSAALERIHPGQLAVIEIPGISNSIDGKVREVQPEQVIIGFSSPPAEVRPGMTARVKIKLS